MGLTFSYENVFFDFLIKRNEKLSVFHQKLCELLEPCFDKRDENTSISAQVLLLTNSQPWRLAWPFVTESSQASAPRKTLTVNIQF